MMMLNQKVTISIVLISLKSHSYMFSQFSSFKMLNELSLLLSPVGLSASCSTRRLDRVLMESSILLSLENDGCAESFVNVCLREIPCPQGDCSALWNLRVKEGGLLCDAFLVCE